MTRARLAWESSGTHQDALRNSCVSSDWAAQETWNLKTHGWRRIFTKIQWNSIYLVLFLVEITMFRCRRRCFWILWAEIGKIPTTSNYTTYFWWRVALRGGRVLQNPKDPEPPHPYGGVGSLGLYDTIRARLAWESSGTHRAALRNSCVSSNWAAQETWYLVCIARQAKTCLVTRWGCCM